MHVTLLGPMIRDVHITLSLLKMVNGKKVTRKKSNGKKVSNQLGKKVSRKKVTGNKVTQFIYL